MTVYVLTAGNIFNAVFNSPEAAKRSVSGSGTHLEWRHDHGSAGAMWSWGPWVIRATTVRG